MYHDIQQLGLLEDEDILLDEAALTLALPDHPDVDLAGRRVLLDAMAEQLRSQSDAALNNFDRALLLGAVIGTAFGFNGATEDYDDPANADLIAVLERRRGMPIALSIVYVAMARRIGWRAAGLNMPGHLLVLVGGQADGVVIDPFNRGAILDRQAVAAMRARFDASGAEHDTVAALSNRAMLVRLLLNQATRARSAGQFERALTVYQRMTAMAPLLSHLWWDRAELEREMGQIAAARASLLAMLETTRDATLRNHIQGALDNLARLVN
jgi:regulator of sirC expression with transglutaminase-like and TPR domain